MTAAVDVDRTGHRDIREHPPVVLFDREVSPRPAANWDVDDDGSDECWGSPPERAHRGHNRGLVREPGRDRPNRRVRQRDRRRDRVQASRQRARVVQHRRS